MGVLTNETGEKQLVGFRDCLGALQALPQRAKESAAWWLAISQCHFFLSSFQLALDAAEESLRRDPANREGYHAAIRSCQFLNPDYSRG
jgi:hypothetical protein